MWVAGKDERLNVPLSDGGATGRINSSEDYTSRPSNVNDPTERDVGVGSSVGATGSGSKNEGKLAHCALLTAHPFTVRKNGQYENQFRRCVASK